MNAVSIAMCERCDRGPITAYPFKAEEQHRSSNARERSRERSLCHDLPCWFPFVYSSRSLSGNCGVITTRGSAALSAPLRLAHLVTNSERPRDPLSHPCRASHKHGVYEAFLNYSQESITFVSNSLVFDATGAACSQPAFSSRMLVAGVV